MKLPNGYGSCYKLKGNRRRPWIARKTISFDENNIQKFYTIGYFETRAKAMSALAEYNKNPLGNILDRTVQETYDIWSKSKYPKISKSTADGYRGAFKYLEPIHNLKINDVRKSHLQAIVDKMSKDGLSKSSYSKVKVLAGLLLKEAMQDGIVKMNYADFVELPKQEQAKKQAFTDLEIKAIEKHAKTDKWANTILIMIFTGMRIGELLSLTKFNVDIENMVITGGIKTDAGKNRVIPVHSKIQEYVKYWYNQNADTLINEDGKRLNGDIYRRRLYYSAIERMGIRKLTPHSCRHTFASLMARAGVDTLSIQRIIGHSKYATTADIYTHTNINELKDAIKKI